MIIEDKDLESILRAALEEIQELEEDDKIIQSIQKIRTYEESNVLSGNRGLVIDFKDGSQFQVTIAKSHYER